MFSELKTAFVSLIVLTIITGIAYPLTVTGIAQVVFPSQANGSLLPNQNGSRLIGQPFDDPQYFWSRLSGASYNPAASSGTNFASTNPALIDASKARIAALQAGDPDSKSPIPVDLVTASGSGLDPHISLESARYQAKRVARARNIDEHVVHALIAAHTEFPTFGLLGEPRVNVVALNQALDLM